MINYPSLRVSRITLTRTGISWGITLCEIEVGQMRTNWEKTLTTVDRKMRVWYGVLRVFWQSSRMDGSNSKYLSFPDSSVSSLNWHTLVSYDYDGNMRKYQFHCTNTKDGAFFLQKYLHLELMTETEVHTTLNMGVSKRYILSWHISTRVINAETPTRT